MTRIQIHDLDVTEELTTAEQRQVQGGWFAIAGAFRYLQQTTGKTYTDLEMMEMLATSQEA